MRNTLAAEARELKRLEQDVKCASAHDSLECLVRLEALARLLLGKGPVGRATAAIAADSVLDEQIIEQRAVRASVERLKGRVRGFLDDFRRRLKLIDNYSGLREPVLAWQGSASDVGNVLASLRDDATWAELELGDLGTLARAVFPALRTWLQTLEHTTPAVVPTRDQWSDRAVELESEIRGAFEKAERAVLYAHTSNHQHTLDVLQRLVCAHSSFACAEVDVEGFAYVASDMTELLHRCERLVSAVRARLLEGPDRSYAVDRLTMQLEHIEKKSLLERMHEADRPEEVFQEAVKRFLYAEGLWPVTQLIIGPGRADVFVEVPTEAEGMRCILLELKQAVRDSSRGAVHKAVTEAFAQAELYSSGLRSSERWKSHEVFCIVAYAGPARYFVPRDSNVRLIYLGDAKPSDGVTPLFAAKPTKK